MSTRTRFSHLVVAFSMPLVGCVADSASTAPRERQQQAQTECKQFPATGMAQLCGPFLTKWREFGEDGGIKLYGYPLSGGGPNDYEAWLERALFRRRPGTDDVDLVNIGARAFVASAGGALPPVRMGFSSQPGLNVHPMVWANAVAPAPRNPELIHFFPFVPGGAIGRFWEQNGAEGQFGFPISPELEDWLAPTGQYVRRFIVQYFERARIEFDPMTNSVSLGLIGKEVREDLARRERVFAAGRSEYDCEMSLQMRMDDNSWTQWKAVARFSSFRENWFVIGEEVSCSRCLESVRRSIQEVVDNHSWSMPSLLADSRVSGRCF